MGLMNVLLCGVAKIAIQLFSYHNLSSYFGRNCRMLCASTIISTAQRQRAVQIKQALMLAVRYAPWYSNCLTQALVAKFWCQYYQIPYMLYIGLAKGSSKPLGKDGHAWVTAGSIAISGGHSFHTHQVVLTYSNKR